MTTIAKHTDMRDFESEGPHRPQANCTVDDVVVHLMRWKREDAQRKYILGKGEGLTRDELAHVHVALKRPTLREQLFGLHEYKRRLREKLGLKNSEKMKVDIAECDALLDKISAFLDGVHDEIAKGNSSALHVDQAASRELGEICVTLSSVKNWARVAHDLAGVLGPVAPQTLEAVQADKPKIESVPLSQHKTNRLYMCFSLAVTALARLPKYRVKDAPNVQGIADALAALALEINKEATGLTAENIKLYIEDAQKVKIR